MLGYSHAGCVGVQRKSQRYYPTMLAINLATGASKRGADSNMPGYIVVETNSRVYAYTGGWTIATDITSRSRRLQVVCS